MASKERSSQTVAPVNLVSLVGRVSAMPESRELPSGDTLVTFRVIVPRPPLVGPGSPGRTRVDVFDVACWSGRTRRSAARLDADAVVRVEGSLRRRFFRTGAGTSSRYEIEAGSVKRMAAAHARTERR